MNTTEPTIAPPRPTRSGDLPDLNPRPDRTTLAWQAAATVAGIIAALALAVAVISS